MRRWQSDRAGKFREMSRQMLRVKSDLQQVVVSADYAKQKFSKGGAQLRRIARSLTPPSGLR